jgi:hypothetical protein
MQRPENADLPVHEFSGGANFQRLYLPELP